MSLYTNILCKPTNYTAMNRTASDIKYIVIHYTGNNGDTAKANANYFNTHAVQASAHYFVDEKDIYMSVNPKNRAWHCGSETGKYYSSCRNTSSIGIEMCSKKDSTGNYYIADATVNNTINLVKELMTKYKVSADNVIRHYDVTHKKCPEPFVRNPNLWTNFKNKLKNSTVNKTVEVKPTRGYAFVDTNTLNVREKPSTDSKIITTVKKYARLEVIGYVGMEWFQVLLNDKKVFVSRDYVKFTKKA